MNDTSTDYSLLFETPSQRNRPTPKLKPNTRFLQNLVRDANSHNAALLAKETADAQARLRQLSRRSRASEADSDDDRSHKRSRGRRHTREKNTRDQEPRHRSADDDRSHHKSARHHSSRHAHSSRRNRDSRSRSPAPAGVDKEEKKRSAGHDRRDRHERSSRGERRRHSHRSRSPQRTRDKRHRERSPASEKAEPNKNQGETRSDADSGSDSDPLAEFIGPRTVSDPRSAAATVRIRGRGAIRGTSSMDRHFSADYDPTADVEGPENGPAVEAGSTVEDARAEMQRDRQKLLREGAARLKAAGFTDREIAIWSRGGKRDVADVQWTKKGEAREWDRGKVAGEDGPAKPEWAR